MAGVTEWSMATIFNKIRKKYLNLEVMLYEASPFLGKIYPYIFGQCHFSAKKYPSLSGKSRFSASSYSLHIVSLVA